MVIIVRTPYRSQSWACRSEDMEARLGMGGRVIKFSQKSWLEGPISDPDLDIDGPVALGRQLVSL